MASTDRLVSIKADETFPTRVQAAINVLIAAGIPIATTVAAGKVRLATTGETTTGTDATIATTPAGVKAAVDAAVSGLLNGAPGALDTLKELADAINDDASFAATVTTALASKVNSSTYTAGLAGKADVSTTAKDLPDTTVGGASGQLAASVTSNVAANGAYTSPALDGAVATPPKRWAIKADPTTGCTITLPDTAGVSTTVTVLPGEVLTFRQKTTSGWGVESGNKPLTQMDARFALRSDPAPASTKRLRSRTRMDIATLAQTSPRRVFGPGLRMRAVIRNDGAGTLQLAYGTANIANYNAPSAGAWNISVPPGSEYLESGAEQALFARPAVDNAALAYTVDLELGA